MKRLLVLLCVCALAAGALAGCGNSAETDYMNQLATDMNAATTELNSIGEVIKNYPFNAADKKALKKAGDGLQAIEDRYRGIDPPERFAELHEKWLTALQSSVKSSRTAAKDDLMKTASALRDTFGEFKAVRDELLALQAE